MLFKPKFLLEIARPGKNNKVILVGTALKAIRIHGTKKINPNTKGSNTVQQTVISWSNLTRGNDALTHTKPNIIIQVFIPNESPEINPSRTILDIEVNDENGNKKPPRNKILVKADISTILAYSAKKNRTNGRAACSVKNPDTSSDSIIYINKGINQMSYHRYQISCYFLTLHKKAKRLIFSSKKRG
jgi:hypothetical protein